MPVPPEPARKRLLDIVLDPMTIAVLLAAALGAIINIFKLTEKLPDRIKQGATPGALTAILTFLLWAAFAIAIALWSRWQERRKHPDGEPTPGRVTIYVAELKGDDNEGSHRSHILLTLRQQLGDSVQVLRAGIALNAEEKGNPEDDARAANRKGQSYLNLSKHKGDLLIWGQVLQESKLVELRFTSAAHEAGEQKRFAFADKMLLAPDFGPELATALAAIAAEIALPAKNPGTYVADVLIPVAAKLGRIVANLPASMGPVDRGALLRSCANAELAIGEQRGDSRALERAIKAYRETIKFHTQANLPLDWARAQNNLGVALETLGLRESGTERLKDAAAAFSEALKEWTRENVPLQWATAENNLGTALQAIGVREGSTERLEAALAAHREALKERPQEKVPLDWAITQANIGSSLFELGKREGGIERLEAAVKTSREALKELAQGKSMSRAQLKVAGGGWVDDTTLQLAQRQAERR
jgi:tetratricopeptide (TPR) repeat protein